MMKKYLLELFRLVFSVIVFLKKLIIVHALLIVTAFIIVSILENTHNESVTNLLTAYILSTLDNILYYYMAYNLYCGSDTHENFNNIYYIDVNCYNVYSYVNTIIILSMLIKYNTSGKINKYIVFISFIIIIFSINFIFIVEVLSYMLDTMYTYILDILILISKKLNKVIIVWYPFINLITDSFLIQIFSIFIMYSLILSTNLYIFLLYVFVLIFLLGTLLCRINLELFGAFLLISEFIIIFITVILLVYINKKVLLKKKINLYYILPLIIILFFINIEDSTTKDYKLVSFYLYEYTYINYYALLRSKTNNDFLPFYYSYYVVNSLCLVFVGYLLLVGSIICITLYKNIIEDKVTRYGLMFKLFKFFKKFATYLFFRTQSLTKQTKQKPSTRYYNKKDD